MTTKTQHTPGPWIARHCDANDSEPHAWKICTDSIDRRQQVVQVVYAERNARLIAASPDLLRELRIALKFLVALDDTSMEPYMVPMRAAILRAEGR